MQALTGRTGTIISAALVAAGAVIAAVGATTVDPLVAGVLPPTGAGLIAAGTIALLQAHAPSAGRLVLVGGAFLVAGVAVAITGAMMANEAVEAALPAVGGALVAVGALALVAGLARLNPPATMPAR